MKPTFDPTERFSDRAKDYATGRPSYPSAALDAIFEDSGDGASLTIVDLGAGTGISSRLLAGRGAATIAVEPNAAMRDQATSRLDRAIRWQTGTAEATGLPDGCADIVTAFQAFHWFERDDALREIARVLRPGGRLAVVYNERDESDAFTADYGRLVRWHATDETERRRSDGRAVIESLRDDAGWRNVRVRETANVQRLDRAGLHERARSTSYLPARGPIADELHAALDTAFDAFAIEGYVTMALRTIVSSVQRA